MISEWFKGRQPLRWVAFLTVLVFSFTTVAPAQATPLLAVSSRSDFPRPPYLELAPVQIPQELGKVEEVFHPKPTTQTPFVYLIQDAHDSLDAQESINRLLKTFVEKEEVSVVCFEGGSLELDRTFYNYSKDFKSNRKLWDRLFEKGQMSGLEMYALEAPHKVRLFGIEDEPVYFENIDSIQKVYEQEAESRIAIQKVEAYLNKMRGKLLTGDLKKLADKRRAFDEKKISLPEYSKFLARWAEKALKLKLSNSASQDEWPQLVRLLKLSEFEARLKKHDAEIEKELIVARKQTSESLEFIWDPSQHYRAQGHLRWYFEHWIDSLSPQHSVFSPALKYWIGFNVLRDEITPQGLFDEIERLEERLLARLPINQEQREFLELEAEWQLAKKLLNLELTREEWNKVRSGDFSRVFKANQQLKSLLQTAHRNYEIVEKRDQILTDRTFNRIKNLKANKMALIIGGFHTSYLIPKLEEKKIGYVVVSPAIKNLNHKLNYHARIQALSKDQTGLDIPSALGSPFSRSRWNQAALVEFAEMAVSTAEGSSLGNELKEIRNVGPHTISPAVLEGLMKKINEMNVGDSLVHEIIDGQVNRKEDVAEFSFNDKKLRSLRLPSVHIEKEIQIEELWTLLHPLLLRALEQQKSSPKVVESLATPVGLRAPPGKMVFSRFVFVLLGLASILGLGVLFLRLKANLPEPDSPSPISHVLSAQNIPGEGSLRTREEVIAYLAQLASELPTEIERKQANEFVLELSNPRIGHIDVTVLSPREAVEQSLSEGMEARVQVTLDDREGKADSIAFLAGLLRFLPAGYSRGTLSEEAQHLADHRLLRRTVAINDEFYREFQDEVRRRGRQTLLAEEILGQPRLFELARKGLVFKVHGEFRGRRLFYQNLRDLIRERRGEETFLSDFSAVSEIQSLLRANVRLVGTYFRADGTLNELALKQAILVEQAGSRQLTWDLIFGIEERNHPGRSPFMPVSNRDAAPVLREDAFDFLIDRDLVREAERIAAEGQSLGKEKSKPLGLQVGAFANGVSLGGDIKKIDLAGPISGDLVNALLEHFKSSEVYNKVKGSVTAIRIAEKRCGTRICSKGWVPRNVSAHSYGFKNFDVPQRRRKK